MPFDSRFDIVDADLTYSVDVTASNLTQNRVIAARPGCWELLWVNDRVRLQLYDDRPGTLHEREVTLVSRPLTANQVHRVSFTVYGCGWEGNGVLSLYVDGELHRRYLSNAYPANFSNPSVQQTFWASAPSDEPITLGSAPDGTRRFQGSLGLPRIHCLALSLDEL